MNRACLLLLALSLAATAAEEFPTSAGPVKITPIRHATMLIEAGGQAIYVDPVGQGNWQGLPSQADLILLTDIHGDHLDPAQLAKLRKPSTVVLAPQAVAAKLEGVTVINNGESKQVGPFKIDAIAAYNLTRGPKPGAFYHDKGRGNGYVFTYGGKRFYISGDTEDIPEMKALRNIDVAFVCMNLPYTMPPEEAAQAVRAFHPKIVYPYHYGKSDLKVFEKGLAGTGIEVRLRNWYPAG